MTDSTPLPLTDDEVTNAVVALAHLLDATGCPAIVVKEVSPGGMSLSLHFNTERARKLAAIAPTQELESRL